MMIGGGKGSESSTTGNMLGAEMASDATNGVNGTCLKNSSENTNKVENLVRQHHERVKHMFIQTDRRFDDLGKDLLELTCRSYDRYKHLRETMEVVEAEVMQLRDTLSDDVADLKKQVGCMNNAIKNLKADLVLAVKTEVQKIIRTEKEVPYVDLTIEADEGKSKPVRRTSSRPNGGKMKLPPCPGMTKPRRKTKKCTAGPFTVGIPVCPEDCKLLDYVFHKMKDGGEEKIAMIICTYLTREDMLTLAPRSPLSTLIIDTVVEKLTLEDECKKIRECAYLPVTFAEKASGDREELLSFIAKSNVKLLYCTDILDCERIFIPIYMGNHFILCVVNLNDRMYSIWDSLPSCVQQTEIEQKLLDLMTSLDVLFIDGNRDEFPGVESFLDFDFNQANYAPRQYNGWDCGMYVINMMKCGRLLNRKTAKVMEKRFKSEEERMKLVLELINYSPKEKTALIEKARELVI